MSCRTRVLLVLKSQTVIQMKLIILCAVLALAVGLRNREKQEFNTDLVTITEDDDYYYMEASGLPDHQYDDSVNINDAADMGYSWTIPRNPTLLDTPSCLPGGTIGFSLDGVPFFNAYTSDGSDAVETERFDDCQGHSSQTGAYHYHQMSSCIYDADDCPGNELVGVALDGIPIYGPCDADGNKLTSADLDVCHGETAKFYRQNGNSYYTYVYRITEDFPYILNCFTYDVPMRNLADGTGSCRNLKSLNAHFRGSKTNTRKSLIQALREYLAKN